KSEGADAVVHSGDFDYGGNPAAWDAQINDILGVNFPYFACVGNHDKAKFYGLGGYQDFIEARMNRLGIPWNGDLGVQSSFKYNGIFFVQTAAGVLGSGHAEYIRNKLAGDNSIWSISSWHKNMHLMQVGSKGDETGWGVYEESRKGGAIIATAHEHSYSRTHLLSSCQNQTVASNSGTLFLTKDLVDTGEDEGKTFVFVSGLGGTGIRNQDRSGEWWASIYTSDQGANYGALFGTFNVNGVPNLAKFYFKDIDGVIPDSFEVMSTIEDTPVPVELALFTATSERNTVRLVWETRTETNNLGFDVERSAAMHDFKRVGFVRGQGSATVPSKYFFEDKNLKVGNYRYRLRQIDLDGTFSYSPILNVKVVPPVDFSLSQNYPNPFNPETEIRFQLPEASHVELKIFNISGQEICTLMNAQYEPGFHSVRWNAKDRQGKAVSSGVYFYQLLAGSFTQVKKMILRR
ncbi:MAG: T9SS type A sorting domain-containing protein, partial [bacterium]